MKNTADGVHGVIGPPRSIPEWPRVHFGKSRLYQGAWIGLTVIWGRPHALAADVWDDGVSATLRSIYDRFESAWEYHEFDRLKHLPR